jgi:hypothetical protein
MVPWFDSIAYNAVMCSLPRFYSNEGMQPETYLDKTHQLKFRERSHPNQNRRQKLLF